MCCNPHAISRRQPRRRRRGGFTFIEVMVVVVIIGMLAGAVTLTVRDRMETARVNTARSDIGTIVRALETYNVEHGGYPSNSEGLENIGIQNRTDPWGQPYQYNKPGQNDQPYEVYSLGADERPGGDGADADIYSWQLEKDR